MNECCLFCVHYVNNKCALPALLCLNYDRFKAVPIVTIHKDDLETKYVSRQSFDEMKARAKAAEARVAELEAADRWIPVEENLPESGRKVLVLLKNKSSFVMFLDKESRWNDGFGSCPFNIVSHWRPLPALPSEARE